ncbi:MAG TPA: MerR family transcriptional regulator, partial [Anaerolineae bacterium]|nr:MerR family transcriptional regulator [Anaerolineae bacterium]
MARGQKRAHLYTSEVAREVGVHPNTVRLYEEWGLLPPVPRSTSGYRLYSRAHLDQMRLARTALHGPWPGRNIRRSVLDMVHQAASGDLGGALEM